MAYIPDLLFGSQVRGALRAVGHEVELVANASGLSDYLSGADALVFDLTDDMSVRVSLFEALSAEGGVKRIHTLAFYSHIEADTRAAAQAAGFELVVPRSRMAREGSALIDGLTRRSRSQTE